MIDVQAVPASEPIVINGRLDERVWETASVIGEFVQREPAEGASPSQRTEARIAFDASAIYVGVTAHDTEPERIVGILTRRDQRSPSDWVKVVIDSYFDRRSAYEFAVNPAGVKLDRYYFNDGNSDDSWDAVWDVAVARTREGWTAEFRIPFSQLRFNQSDEGSVGFAVIREIGRLAETSTWPLLSRNANGFVSQFAEVHGLRRSGSPKRFELLPYTLGRVSTRPADPTFPQLDTVRPAGTVGLDMKYAVRPGLTLTATVNPDFGQVEADPAVVNLDAFETFFQERRPFFVEGSGIFQFNMDCNDGQCTGLFYSRRVGRAPQGAAQTGEGERAVTPEAATILGAAKLTGRVGRFSLGALTALTAEEQSSITGGALGRTQTVEPFTAYSVMRARREFANQSNIGVMLTTTSRQITDAVAFLPEAAYTGGVDYDIRLSSRFNISGFWAGSRVQGSEGAILRLQRNTVHAFQRPDADHVALDPEATSLSGHAGAVAFGKIGGEKTRFNSYLGYKSPGFDMNDLGFQRRADERMVSNWFQWRDNVPGRFMRQWTVNINQWAGWNFDGDRLFSGGNVNMHFTWANYYSNGFGINVNAAPLRDRVTRGGPAVLGAANLGLWYYANTDNRKALSFSYNGYHGRDREGGSQNSFNVWTNWRPTAAVSVNVGLRYSLNDDPAQWVENVQADGRTRYVFGALDQTTAAVTVRVNYTLTPNLSIQTWAEPFVSAGRYADFREVVNGRAPAFADRFAAVAYQGNPDFNYRSFRTTNVLRWEYRPGSTLFLVWQQGRQDQERFGDFRPGRDFGGAFGAPAHNVFLVKLAYWLNM
ncbi:MAG: DUF5916 domain-containing protein [Acidobacteriota bacterium]